MKRGSSYALGMRTDHLPPQLVSNFIKFLNIFLVENSHVVQALPPFRPDHRHVLRNGTPALHSGTIPTSSARSGHGCSQRSSSCQSFQTKWERFIKNVEIKTSDLYFDRECSCWGERWAFSQQKETKVTEQWTCTSRATSRLLELILPPDLYCRYYFPGHSFELLGNNTCQFLRL